MFGLEAIWRDGQVVGHVRRADFGFAIDKTLAYGYIRDPSGGPVSWRVLARTTWQLGWPCFRSWKPPRPGLCPGATGHVAEKPPHSLCVFIVSSQS